MGLVPLIVIIVCLLFKMATVPATASSFSAIIVGTFNHHFKMTDGFKATFSGFNDSMSTSVSYFIQCEKLVRTGRYDEYDPNISNEYFADMHLQVL